MIALVRAPGDSYRDATRSDPSPIDVPLARAQHAAYVEGLRWLGHRVVALPADERFPDGCFVEDQALVVGGRALILRSGHPGRRGEADAVAAALAAEGLEVRRMAGEGSVDGGDVLRVGRTLLVGRSARTDEAGVRAVAAAFPDLVVREVEVPAGVLHLKCVCSSPVPGLVVVADGAVPPSTFSGLARVLVTPAADAWAANLVGEGSRVLVGAGHPAVTAALRAEGLACLELDASEIRRGDGSLTCLSLIGGQDARC